MLRSNTKCFAEIRQYLDSVPVIETHEHYAAHDDAGDTLDFILGNYYRSDFMSAGGDETMPDTLSLRERYERFMSVYKRSDKTAYARSMMEGLRRCWGVTSIDSYDDFLALDERLKTRDAGVYARFMGEMGIKAKIVDIFDLSAFVEGANTGYSAYSRFAFPLPFFHNIHTKADLLRLERYADGPITCLDDYLRCFDAYFDKSVAFGAVCVKDQSAYRRTLAYGHPARADAERVFNDIVFNPREVVGDERARTLDDWLFGYAMRKAAAYGLPVQLHTGHMAGIRNEISKTNASHLIPIIELHQDVRFALFHGNWPYMDEYLFMGKNYPNVYLDLCWVQSIDPLYSVELMKRAVMTVPHSKLFAFGGDTRMIEWAVGYLSLARDNVACALAELIDCGWLDIEEAKRIAADWFFNNPNGFYGLGFEAV